MRSKLLLTAGLAALAIGCAYVDISFRSDRAYAQSGGPTIPPAMCNQLDRCPLFKGLSEQVKALEAKVVAQDKKIAALEAAVKGINSAPARFKMVNDKTSQCLMWVDNNRPPLTLSCDHDYQIWRMEKVN